VVDKGSAGATEWLDGTEGASVLSSEGPSEPHLLIMASDGTWVSRALPEDGSLTIGRGAEVDVRVDERAVSRRHARLDVAVGTGSFRVVDLNSANGTLVGNKLVRDDSVAVQPGEPILIGRTVVTVRMPARCCAQQAEPGRQAGRDAMAGVEELIAKGAPTMISVLLLGETGVGKDVLAEEIHRRSPRASGPLVRINCAGLSPALLESELFGHERGAFTGATHCKPGMLEAAAGGTVLLDEIGEMPLEVQAKLLLALEQRMVRRVGATHSEPIDVRLLFATHRDVEAEVRAGRFRADFYYRINGLTIHIPPLRQRRDEIDGLVAQFAREAAARLGLSRPPSFDEAARQRLRCSPWPGNIRELRSVVERAVLLADSGHVTVRVLLAAGLPAELLLPNPDEEVAEDDDPERQRVIAALAACGGNQSRAARMLGLSRNTLISRIRQYGLVRPHRQGCR
jgi:two-component system, NtrC family, response regulator AtoC